jgi:hypothetical protein
VEKSASSDEGKMEARFNFGVDLRAMNASLETPGLRAELRDVRAGKWAQFTNPMYDNLYHFTEKIAGGQIAGKLRQQLFMKIEGVYQNV